jgi:hypothetical protein
MSEQFNGRRQAILEKRLAELYEEYEAAYAQLGRMLADVDALKIRRQIAYLDEAIKEVEEQLAQFGQAGGRGETAVASAPSMTEPADAAYLIKLVEIINHRFDLSELHSLALHFSIDLDDLPSGGKRRKVEELVKYLNRHLRLGELVSVGRRERPDIDWPVSG